MTPRSKVKSCKGSTGQVFCNDPDCGNRDTAGLHWPAGHPNNRETRMIPREKEPKHFDWQNAMIDLTTERDDLIILLRECREWLDLDDCSVDFYTKYQDFRKRLDEAIRGKQ